MSGGPTPLAEVLGGRHLPALDGMRALLVLVVMLYHGGLAVPGDLGVTGFFVLSGFLITWLLLRERERTGTIWLRGFYLRRTLRIFPAYFVFVGVSMAADAALGLAWEPSEVVSALTYTVNYDNAFTGHDHPVAHAWSLAVEEQFYLLWPVLFLLLSGRRALGRGLVGLLVLVCAWRTLLVARLGAEAHYVYNAFDTRFDSLAVGCLLAVLCTSPRFVEGARRVAARAWYPLPVVAALYASRALVGPAWHYTLGMTADSLLLGLLLLQLVQLHATPAWRWLDHRAVVWAGTLSYPLYLWHQWGLAVGADLAEALPLRLVLGIGGAFALASFSYYAVELPFLRLKARLAGGRAAAPGAGVPASASS